jgi:hypothetical protein
MELLNKAILLDIIQDADDAILFNISHRRKIYTSSVSKDNEGSAIVTIFDAQVFMYDEKIYSTSEWKYKDIKNDGPLVEAVWEKSEPWVLGLEPTDQFMCKTLHRIRIGSDNVEMTTWKSGGYELLQFTVSGLSEIFAECDDNKKYLDLMMEIINKSIELNNSTVGEIVDHLS